MVLSNQGQVPGLEVSPGKENHLQSEGVILRPFKNTEQLFKERISKQIKMEE